SVTVDFDRYRVCSSYRPVQGGPRTSKSSDRYVPPVPGGMENLGGDISQGNIKYVIGRIKDYSVVQLSTIGVGSMHAMSNIMLKDSPTSSPLKDQYGKPIISLSGNLGIGKTFRQTFPVGPTASSTPKGSSPAFLSLSLSLALDLSRTCDAVRTLSRTEPDFPFRWRRRHHPPLDDPSLISSSAASETLTHLSPRKPPPPPRTKERGLYGDETESPLAAVGGRPDEGLCGKKLLAELGRLGARVGKGEGTPKAPRELSRSSWCRVRQCPILDSSARTEVIQNGLMRMGGRRDTIGSCWLAGVGGDNELHDLYVFPENSIEVDMEEMGEELEGIRANNPPSEPYVTAVPLQETNEIDDTDMKTGGGGADVRKELIVPVAGDEETPTTKAPVGSAPKDVFHVAYAVYFTLGAGFLLPWNAFITAVDYFSYLYRGTPVDRVFSVAYMVTGLLLLLVIVFWARRSSAPLRVNAGLGLFVAALLVVPVMDAAYVRGTQGRYAAFDVTVGAVVLSGLADALVQSGVIGSAGELPERYTQAVIAGTAASGTDSFSDLCIFRE
ncbi:hypothetical protein BHM03_00048734, partial [Ensete ventricosum]